MNLTELDDRLVRFRDHLITSGAIRSAAPLDMELLEIIRAFEAEEWPMEIGGEA